MTTPRQTFEGYNPYRYPDRYVPPKTKFEELVPEEYRSSITGPFVTSDFKNLTYPKTSSEILKAFTDFTNQLNWAIESAFIGSDTFEKYYDQLILKPQGREGQGRDLAPWQLPFDIASKHPSVHPTARHLSGTLSDETSRWRG